ncbi:MAG: DUF1828 domain-containing protein [Oligoflexia bacterium]|nr:DUF1828 domain-containing protein [Oligoflexia bacterium]
MDIKNILAILNSVKTNFSSYERRPGKYQLTVPILHEDGDMVDIYLQDSPKGEGYIRICDFGMTLMRLSYTYEINTTARQKIFNSILINNGIENENGNLYLDSYSEKIHESIFQFAGCVQKICSMDYWSKKTSHSTFYKDLQNLILKKCEDFKPQPDIAPLSKNELYKTSSQNEIFKVDWSLNCNDRDFYLFGIPGNDKAKDTAIALLEFKKANLSFISLVVHEDIESLGNKEATYLTRNADKQYPCLGDFNSEGISDIKRLAS